MSRKKAGSRNRISRKQTPVKDEPPTPHEVEAILALPVDEDPNWSSNEEPAWASNLVNAINFMNDYPNIEPTSEPEEMLRFKTLLIKSTRRIEHNRQETRITQAEIELLKSETRMFISKMMAA